MAQKIGTFSTPILEWETLLRRSEGSFAAAYLRLSESGLQVRCGEGLHFAVKRYAIAWSASLLCTRDFHCCSSLCFLLQFFYVAPQTRGSVDYPSTHRIQVDVGLPDATSENQAKSPLYGELYPNKSPA